MPLIGYTHVRKTPVRARIYSDEEMLKALRRLLKQHGTLSRPIIDGTKGVASSSTYTARFGSMDQAYQLIGFTPPRARGRPTLRGMSNAQMLDLLTRLWRERGRLSRSIIEENKTVPSHYAYDKRFGGLKGAYKLIGYTPRTGGLAPR